MLLDAICLLVSIIILHGIKSRNENLLFFCNGARMYLPPSPTQQEIHMFELDYKHIQNYPFSEEYNRILLTITALIIYLTIFTCTYIFAPSIIISSMLPFFVCTIITCYTIKQCLYTFYISTYYNKNTIIIALITNLFYFIIYILTDVFNHDNLRYIIHDYNKHITFIMGKQLRLQLNRYLIMIIILTSNFIITLSIIPNVIKFGNFYLKNLKNTYNHNLDDTVDQNIQKITIKQSQKSKKILWMLNAYLGLSLIMITVCLESVKECIVHIDIVRILLMIVTSAIIFYSLKDSIQFHGSFAEDWLIKYIGLVKERRKMSQNELKQIDQNLQVIRTRISQYIYHLWYHLFQFALRGIIPILLFITLMFWKYNIRQQGSIYDYSNVINKQGNSLVSQYNCKFKKGLSLSSIYRCPLPKEAQAQRVMENQSIYQEMQLNNMTSDINYNMAQGINYNMAQDINYNRSSLSDRIESEVNQSMKQRQQYLGILNGLLIYPQIEFYESIYAIQERIYLYGLLPPLFMIPIMQYIYWYGILTIYLYTIVYIILVRKTFYNI